MNNERFSKQRYHALWWNTTDNSALETWHCPSIKSVAAQAIPTRRFGLILFFFFKGHHTKGRSSNNCLLHEIRVFCLRRCEQTTEYHQLGESSLNNTSTVCRLHGHRNSAPVIAERETFVCDVTCCLFQEIYSVMAGSSYNEDLEYTKSGCFRPRL